MHKSGKTSGSLPLLCLVGEWCHDELDSSAHPGPGCSAALQHTLPPPLIGPGAAVYRVPRIGSWGFWLKSQPSVLGTWGTAGSSLMVLWILLQPSDVERQQFSTFHAQVQPPVLSGARPRLIPIRSEYATCSRPREEGSRAEHGDGGLL